MGKGVTMVTGRMMDHQHLETRRFPRQQHTLSIHGTLSMHRLYHSKRSVDECCSVPLGLVGLRYSSPVLREISVAWGLLSTTTKPHTTLHIRNVIRLFCHQQAVWQLERHSLFQKGVSGVVERFTRMRKIHEPDGFSLTSSTIYCFQLCEDILIRLLTG